MKTLLKDKIILITGASSGIGYACAQRLAAEGARLILTARRVERLQELVASLNNINPNHYLLVHYLDVADNTSVNNFFTALPAAWQGIDILINNAGLALATDPIQSGSIENWETMIDTNIKGLLNMSRHVLPIMLERQAGHVVNIGSVAGQDYYPNGNVYSATKHAVRAITKSMRLDLSGSPIRVTEIAPGAVETEFSQVRWNDKERADKFYQDFNPLQANDIADAVWYCLTRPSHVNIAELTVFPTDQASCHLTHRRK